MLLAFLAMICDSLVCIFLRGPKFILLKDGCTALYKDPPLSQSERELTHARECRKGK